MPSISVDHVSFEMSVPSMGMFVSAFGPDDDAQTSVVPFEDRAIEVLAEDRGMVVGPRRIGYP